MNSTTVKMQTLRCHHGEGHDWTRPSQRGKPPHFCPEHKPERTDAQIAKDMARVAREGTTTDQVLAQHDRKVTGGNLSDKIAQANDEVAELDAEEARKKAEAAAKRQATIAARKEQEEREAAQNAVKELERLTTTIPQVFTEYEQALDKANKTNKVEDWHTSEILMDRVLSMRSRQRNLESQVSA